MSWLFRNRKVPTTKQLCWWIGSIGSEADRREFIEMRKRCQQALFELVGSDLMQYRTEQDAITGTLLVHFLSGRGSIPDFRTAREVEPVAFERAEKLFASWEQKLGDLNGMSMMLCSLNISAEVLAGTYDNARIVATYGLERWPDNGELWRQRGVVNLSLQNYGLARIDLKRAFALQPSLVQLSEPLNAALRWQAT